MATKKEGALKNVCFAYPQGFIVAPVGRRVLRLFVVQVTTKDLELVTDSPGQRKDSISTSRPHLEGIDILSRKTVTPKETSPTTSPPLDFYVHRKLL